MKCNGPFRNDDYAMNLTYVIEAIFLHGYQVSSVRYLFRCKTCLILDMFHVKLFDV